MLLNSALFANNNLIEGLDKNQFRPFVRPEREKKFVS